ncbi:polysaccharide deacetylase [Mycolicibacterium sp. F2034L]|uniref:polysaccharide deacetylase family protein n=1 Tax=Mycolicibacterium sp. F2034L TaxID=2926422 RepID=UPI001FF2BD4C|nr:polysaccharide deacetylase [Mycolicibacterium sp. F2034L]MCK0177497.1 polysaccharide deacetylase [Mycolicibacterium sp. F2034L]
MTELRWPDGKVAAAAFTFDVDAESAVLWGPPGNLEAVGARMSVMSHQAYGPLVGIPRILDLLERHQIPSTFFVPGHTADRYPDAIRSIVAAGHEIAHHGYLHEQPTALTLEEEIDVIDRGLAALADVAGVRPVGYRAPMWDLSWRTPALLAERGFLFDSSLMDADHPYELAVPGHDPLVEIPIQWALDDWEQYCFLPDISGSGLIESPRKARELWQLEFDGLRRAGGCWVLTNHPFLTGRTSRAAELDDLMRYVLDHGDVWTTNLGAIAEHVRGLGLPPRSITPPM